MLLQPGLSLSTQALIRVVYGVLLLLTLLETLPQARRFFTSERWGGYAKSDPRVDLIQNPFVMPVLMAVWIGAAIALVAGRYTVVASLLNLVLCRYFFVAMRWKGILRGMGAPGFMTYWLAACVFFLEYGAHADPTGRVRTMALLAFRVDFAVIMLCAGTYKALAGYARNDGMELGMINPWWGYWGRLYRRLPPSHWLFRTFNHLAYGTEIVAGVLMLIPATQFWGALLIALSFIFIALHIRLAFLCEMVIVAAGLFIPAGHAVDSWLAAHLAPATAAAEGPVMPALLSTALAVALGIYVVLLPLAKVGQYVNLLRRRAWPATLQTALDRYTNFFGIIIWRVFSADHTNFFVRTVFQDPVTGIRHVGIVSRLSRWLRAWHVGECICLVSLFTTLQYYPSNARLFTERLLRYARTLPRPPGTLVVFEYVEIRKSATGFTDVPVVEYVVDVEAATVAEQPMAAGGQARRGRDGSPVAEAMRPGTYAPAAQPR
jgi:hypothetical protein